MKRKSDKERRGREAKGRKRAKERRGREAKGGRARKEENQIVMADKD